MGYPIIKKGKRKKKDEKVQRIRVQRPMKGKCFKFHKAKERPSQPKSVSQKRSPIGETGLRSQKIPEPGDP